MGEERFYRDFSASERWTRYRVRVESSDLYICSRVNQAFLVQQRLRAYRRAIEDHINRQPEFLDALTPVTPLRRAPEIVERMYRAADLAGTGPMAAVAGAVAEFVARDLQARSEEVVVENGGDNFLILREPCASAIYAGTSPFSGALGLRIAPEKTPLAVCTSSGTVGHSYSRGRVDAATIVSRDACLADAVATGAANMVRTEHDLEAGLDYAMNVPGVLGAVLICGQALTARGDLEFIHIEPHREPA